ncbi:MAG: acyltransferase family protein [Maricaulaceae bacterium]
MRDPAIDSLRSTLTIMVLTHHSAVGYTTFAISGGEDYRGGTAPVVDEGARWVVLDHAQNFNDVFFMSAMFFISGLFVWPSFEKSGVVPFIKARAVRLGLPFVFGTALIMPLAYYPAWRLAGGGAGYLDYWVSNLTEHGATPGPLWFIWMLLAFNLLIAGLSPLLRRGRSATSHLLRTGQNRPWTTVLVLLIMLSGAYFPLLIVFGPDAWGPLPVAPFYGQLSRVLLYACWFVFGVALGAAGLETTVFRRNGPIIRHGVALFLGAIGFYLLMNFLPRILLAFDRLDYPQARALYDVLWVPSCVLSTLGFFALFRKTIASQGPIMTAFTRAAYGVYIVHYGFVLWLQWAFLEVPLHAAVKFVLVFAGALMLSWLTVIGLLKLPGVQRAL